MEANVMAEGERERAWGDSVFVSGSLMGMNIQRFGAAFNV